MLGTLSGSLNKLPRSGDWMVWVRKIFGFILIAMAFYFLNRKGGNDDRIRCHGSCSRNIPGMDGKLKRRYHVHDA